MYCKDCKYFHMPPEFNPDPSIAECHHAAAFIKRELVLGKKYWITCQIMRVAYECGPDAELFQKV